LSRIAYPLITMLMTAILTLVVGRIFVLCMHTGSGAPRVAGLLSEPDCEAMVTLDGVRWIRFCSSAGVMINVRWIEQNDDTCFDPCCGKALNVRHTRARLDWEVGADSLAVGIDAFDLTGSEAACLPLWMCGIVVPRAFLEPQDILRSVLARPRTFACRIMSMEHGYRQERELHSSDHGTILLELDRPAFEGRVVVWNTAERRLLMAYIQRVDGEVMTMAYLRQFAASIRCTDGRTG